MNLLTISTNSPYISAILAQQQVLGDQTQVQSDQVQLRQDQAQLNIDSTRAATAQQQAQTILQNQGVQAQQADLGQLALNAQPAPAQPAAQQAPTLKSSQATVNTSGQTVGAVINVVA